MQELVILDLDGVIINGQSQQFFLNYLFKKKMVGLFFYLKLSFWFVLYKLGIIKDPERIMKASYSFLKGRNCEEIAAIVGDFFSEQLKKFIFSEIIGIIDEHNRKNRELLIASNAVDFIVKRIADFLGIKNYIATKLESAGGKFSGEISGEIVYGEKKAGAVRSFIKENNLSLSGSWAYTDHFSDLPLLFLVDNPRVVNPDKFLLFEARKRNWPILKFKNIISTK